MSKWDDVWGSFEDAYPYYVKAEGKTLEEAGKHLEELVNELDDDWQRDPRWTHLAFPTVNRPVSRTVMACKDVEYGPCDDPTCPHLIEEMVWEFELRYRDEVTPEEEAHRFG